MDEVELLRQLVRVPSVNPTGAGEAEVAERLREVLTQGGLATEILTSPGGRPSLIARLPGSTDRPALVLLSHTDVVPVEEGVWRHDPFGGETIDGELWGRGTLDMKAIAVMHAAAALTVAAGDDDPAREVVVVAVADEEAGGGEGAEWLVRDHPSRVGFRDGGPPPEVLGEGGFGLSGILPRPIMPIVTGEKSPLRFLARASGHPGHGSLPPPRQAIQDLVRFVESVSGPGRARVHPVMREQFAVLAEVADGAQAQLFRLLAGPGGDLAVRVLAPELRRRSGAIGHLLADTITPTRLSAGYKDNVVPGHAEASFDARLLPDTDPDAVLRRLRHVGARHGVEVDELARAGGPTSGRTALLELLVEVSELLPSAPVTTVSLTPGVTDLRFFRARGAVGYGWAPLVLSPELLATFHGTDERIPVDGFLAASTAMRQVVVRAVT